MGPLMAMALLSGAQSGLGLLQGRSAQKAAKKQRERDMRMQMARDLVSAAGGQGLATLGPIAEIPDANTAAALGQGLGTMSNFMGLQYAADTKAGYDRAEADRAYSRDLNIGRLNNENRLSVANIMAAAKKKNSDFGVVGDEEIYENLVQRANLGNIYNYPSVFTQSDR